LSYSVTFDYFDFFAHFNFLSLKKKVVTYFFFEIFLRHFSDPNDKLTHPFIFFYLKEKIIFFKFQKKKKKIFFLVRKKTPQKNLRKYAVPTIHDLIHL
jgi:hypothetical protein